MCVCVCWCDCVFFSREKSKKAAEQAAAIVCLRVLGIPEGRIGEEDSGLVCKRKREGRMNGGTEEERRKKLHVADVPQETETAVVIDENQNSATPQKQL